MIHSSLLCYRAIAVRIVLVGMLALPLNGCLKFLYEGEEAPLGKKKIMVTVPAGKVPPTVKPLPEECSDTPPKEQCPPAPIVEEKLLPHESPPAPDPLGIVPMKPNAPAGNNSLGTPLSDPDRRIIVTQGDFSYENATLDEDVTWRGTVLIRGSVVIAPQATLRIEPGTIVRFIKSPVLNQAPRLVVMGRLQCNGSAEKPVLFAPNLADAARGDWGGILLLNSEKRNQLDNCRIEGAETAIESRFSTFSAKGVSISRSGTGLLLRDSTATLLQTIVGDCESGLEAHDSELELREGTFANNRRGIAAYRSALVLVSMNVRDSDQQGILTDECRIKFNSCELSGNGVGALLKGGEGQVFLSRFVRNHEVGLHLSGARIRIQRSLFADNLRDGIRMDDGRGVVWASAFNGNGGYNLANKGQEDVCAVENWWGSNDEKLIMAKLQDTAKDAHLGQVAVFPWLAEKPAGVP